MQDDEITFKSKMIGMQYNHLFFVIFIIQLHVMMKPLKNVIYIARRFKLATVFNLMGLIVAFGSLYVMMTQIIYQYFYNDGLEDCERLYRVDTDFLNVNHILSDNIFYPIVDVLKRMPDQVESYSLMEHINNDPVFASLYQQAFKDKNGEEKEFLDVRNCNETAVSTLTSKVLSGSIEWRADDPDPDRRGVIIPRSIAEEYFGRIDVAGDSMMAVFKETPGKEYAWRIRGVYEDFPDNSEMQNSIYEVISEEEKTNYYKYNISPIFKCFIKFRQVPEDSAKLNKSFKQAILDMMEAEGWENYASEADMSVSSLKKAISEMRVSLVPLKDSYFLTAKSISSAKHGYKPMLIFMIVSCLLLIVLVTFHFLNFILVQSPMRIRGVNTRLVMGASRRSIQYGLIAECVITSVTACVIALILCDLLFWKHIIDPLIDSFPTLRDHALTAAITLCASGVVGIAAGIYPAAFVTSFVPAMVLKGNFGLTKQGHKLRKTIIWFQLFISFLMVIYLGILVQEKHYIYNSTYGYNKNHVLLSTLTDINEDSVRRVLHQELMAVPGIRHVSFTDGSLGLSDIHGSELIEKHGNNIIYDFTHVDTAYLNTMGVHVVDGRPLLPSDTAAAIINKFAQERWGEMKIGSKIPPERGEDSLTIIGVCEDIRYNTTRVLSKHPFAFICERGSDLNTLAIKCADDADVGNIKKVADEIIQKHVIDSTKIKTPEDSLKLLIRKQLIRLSSFDKKLENSYETEFRFFKWIYLLGIVCIVITLIGLFCVNMFEAESRRKEIGIRKIAGATTGEIIMMLCRQYFPLIITSFAVAVPIAYISGEKTLQPFAEHTSIYGYWWIFPVALLIVGGITIATILLQSWRTARENPVDSIKAE